MIPVTLQPRARTWPTESQVPLLDSATLNEVLANQSEDEAFTVCAIVDAELRRCGHRFAPPGGSLWNAVQRRVMSDILSKGLDLFEIGAQIQEARFSGDC